MKVHAVSSPSVPADMAEKVQPTQQCVESVRNAPDGYDRGGKTNVEMHMPCSASLLTDMTKKEKPT
jgi:hypothetical protein